MHIGPSHRLRAAHLIFALAKPGHAALDRCFSARLFAVSALITSFLSPCDVAYRIANAVQIVS